jgi:hypothetical protein
MIYMLGFVYNMPMGSTRETRSGCNASTLITQQFNPSQSMLEFELWILEYVKKRVAKLKKKRRNDSQIRREKYDKLRENDGIYDFLLPYSAFWFFWLRVLPFHLHLCNDNDVFIVVKLIL